MHFTTYTLNTYFAMLIVTIIASGASLLIVHVATAKAFPLLSGDEAQYAGIGV